MIMFRSIIFYFCVFLFVSCGVGSYSVSSGVPDRSMISFCASSKYSITVYIDGEMHQTQTVKQNLTRVEEILSRHQKPQYVCRPVFMMYGFW